MDPSELDFLMAPDDAQARELAQARLRALRRGRPQAAALALTPEPGLRRAGENLLSEGQRAEERLAQAAQGRQEMALQRERVRQGWAGLQQGRWAPVVHTNPVTGEQMSYMLDTRTGQVRQLGPQGLGGAPGAQAGGAGRGALPPMKMNEAQMKMSGNIGSAVTAMQRALRVGFPRPNVSGLGQSVGQLASRRGFPALASPEAEQTYAAWFNVVAPIVHARTGQQMSVQELEREFAALVPRPGEAPETHLMKVQQLIPTLRDYTVGLPPALAERLNADLDQAEQLVPRSIEELEAMRATGGGGQPAAQQQAPAAPRATSRSGRPMRWR